MAALPKVASDNHVGEGVSATPSTVEDDPALGALTGKLHRFAVRNHEWFAGFAAAKYTKHGPGALFVFGNCGMEHMLSEEGDALYDEAVRCERHVILVWGGTTDKAASDCSLEDFTVRCLQETATLRQSVATGCDRERFPMVLCAGWEYATDDVREGLRRPTWNQKQKGGNKKGASGRYSGVGGAAVMGLQYGDFRAALGCGLKLGLEDALVVELDREND